MRTGQLGPAATKFGDLFTGDSFITIDPKDQGFYGEKCGLVMQDISVEWRAGFPLKDKTTFLRLTLPVEPLRNDCVSI